MSIPLAKQIALVVIDMQPSFLTNIQAASRIAKRCRFAISVSKLFGIKVLFTEQVPEKLGHTLPELIDADTDAIVLSKTSFSAFGAKDFKETLRRSEIRHLLITGIETPICIYNTALQAQAHGMEVTLLEDCIGARRTEDANSVLNFLSQNSDCHILPSETIFYSLLQDAENSLFKEYTNLVKGTDII